MTTNENASLDNATEIIERFGGIRPMSTKTNIPVTTIQGWKKRDTIPGNRVDEIVKAAKANDVDLSGLIGHGANENKIQRGAVDMQASSVEAEVSGIARGDIKTIEAQAARDKAPAFFVDDSMNDSKDPAQDFAAALADVEKKAVGKSAFISLILIGIVIGGAAAALWPHVQGLVENGNSVEVVQEDIQNLQQQVGEVQSDVASVKQQQGSLMGMMPDGWQSEFETLRSQAAALKQQGEALQGQARAALDQAGGVTADVLGGNTAEIQARLAALEEYVRSLGVSESMSTLVMKMRAMQSSPDGRDTLSMAMSELNQALQKGPQNAQLNDNGFDMNVMLDDARDNSSVLGETFAGIPEEQMKAAALLFTMNQFRSALNRDNEAFDDDLSVLKNLVGNADPELTSALDALAPHAKDGVLTIGGLSGELRSLAGDAVVASLKGEDVSIQEKAKARMNEIFSIEKDGELLTGTDTQGQIVQAENLLNNGDLEQAISTVEGMSPEVKAVLGPWLNNAKITLAAQKAKRTLGEFAAGDFSVLGGGEFISYPEYDMYIYKPGAMPKMPSAISNIP